MIRMEEAKLIKIKKMMKAHKKRLQKKRMKINKMKVLKENF